MTANTYFIDTNVWLYRLFDDKKIGVAEKDRKRNIAILEIVNPFKSR